MIHRSAIFGGMETKRPTSPAAEEILGGYFPALDHGFVALVDYMGTDDDVERAARVSYGYGTRKVSATRGLVRYLRRHRHTTPSEMVEFKFHCAMPMFVARQWIRHRTACLAEGTEVYFDLPGGLARRGNQLYKLRVEEIWERFQPTENRTRADKQRNSFDKRDRVRGMKLRQVNEDSLELRHTRVVDVYRNGRKPVFRMTLADGKQIEATSDHRFLFADGWNTLGHGTGLRQQAGRAVWHEGDSFLYVNGAAEERPSLYRDRVVVGKELEYVGRLGGGAVKTEWVPRERVAWNRLDSARLVRIIDFEFVGEKETYDVEVEGPYHNFIANGIVTHNSVNEYSGRYSLMPLLYYMPEREQFALQSTQNQQGRETEASDDLYAEATERWRSLREAASDGYTWMVGEDVAREIARIDLPLSTYTQWYWKINLHNLLHFLSLRADPHAQWEIQVFAEIIAGMVKRVAPLSYEAWVDYDLVGQPMSRAELEVLSRLLVGSEHGISARAGASLDADGLKEAGLSPREVRELLAKLQAPTRPDFELDLSKMKSAEEVGKKMSEAVPGSFE